MRSDSHRYDRYVVFQTPTIVNTKGSQEDSYATVFTGWAGKVDFKRSNNDTDIQSGQRTTEESATWVFPYNTAINSKGRFYVDGDTSYYWDVVGINENLTKSEMLIEAEVKR